MMAVEAPPSEYSATRHDDEAARFKFGDNWTAFLHVIDEARISEAESSMVRMLGPAFRGATFIDVGCGSGLFSLAAMRLGAARVHSFDFDAQSAACAAELKRRYFPDSSRWTVEQGSVLDERYLATLGSWDIVYSWGVLHHTGRMWDALGRVAALVKEGGLLAIAIYNDQGPLSVGWTLVKRNYNRGPLRRTLIMGVFALYCVCRGLVVDLIKRRNPLTRYREYKRVRGMSVVTDWRDWLGGYPFEVAKPEEIFSFYRKRGFALEGLTTCGGRWGCNEFVLRNASVESKET
jgi:2-polyprenyl-6-hydroxyphenyl methylase/3-demethylubiquinone-9 3-methyltransferase